MQAAQDLQIDARVSRTQFQYILEDADAEELPMDSKAGQKLGNCRSSAMWPAINK